MTLRLKRIRLKNWKCYQDTIIPFDLNTDKNVWIVFGNNGYGKTSILEAILWCLYGGEVISKTELVDEKKPYFHNGTVKENPKLELSVQLTFEQDGKNYFISRTAKRLVRGMTVYAEVEEATFNIDGQNKNDSREYIEALLPKSCKDFFFFDGVKIQDYARLTQTEDTRKAIERILGIPELKNLRDDSKKARQILEKKLSEASETNQILKQVTEQLAEFQDEIEAITGQLETAKQEHEAAQKILKGCQERASQIEDLRVKLNEIVMQEREKENLQENLNNIEKEVENAFKKASIPLMLNFVREVADDLQRKSMTTARRSGSVAQLRELLEADTCLCGRCMDESARNYILKQLENLESSGKLIQEAVKQDKLRDDLAVLSRYKTPDFDGLLLKRDRIQDDLEDIKQSISRLKRDTEGVNQNEAAVIWKKVGEAEQKVKEKETQINSLTKGIERLKHHEDHLHREREKLAGQNKETAMLAKQVKLAKRLYDAANELIEWHIDQCKRTIEDRTSELHQHVTNKPDEYMKVQIKDNYTLGVKTVNGDVLSPEILSPGEKEALAFSFITGLNLASGTAAPLIMDTLFGHLDTQHQKNIVNALPKLPSQVIVLATDRDFPDYLLQELQPHVAQIHHIRRPGGTEDVSTVEVDN